MFLFSRIKHNMVSGRKDPTNGSIQTPSNCVVHHGTGNTAEQWRRWEQQFRFYFAAAELSKKTAKTQVAILLHCAGPEAQDIIKNIQTLFLQTPITTQTPTGSMCSRNSDTIANLEKMRCLRGTSSGSETSVKGSPLTSVKGSPLISG